jgi:phage tail-like protein
MNNDSAGPVRYKTFLPELFQESEVPSQPTPAVHRLLDLIESVFADFGGKVDQISDFFDPAEAPMEFLPWLASWMALVLRADWEESQQRAVIAKIIPLYRKRGTRGGLEEYLKIYAGEGVTIKDEVAPLDVGVSSTVGVDTVIGGLPPYFFIINVAFGEPEPAKLKAKAKAVEAVLEIEKPAHTFYKLNLQAPTLQIGTRATIGKDTLI